MATTATDPTGTPVSSPATTFLNPATGNIEPLTGTGTSTNTSTIPAASAFVPTGEATYPTISIRTSFAQANAVAVTFEYMPESVSFGVSAEFDEQAIAFTSARWLTYNHSNIEEVSLNVRVVAGCNNCITMVGGNVNNKSLNLNYTLFGGLVTGKYERNSLITIAQLLYALPLPATNSKEVQGETSSPPPTCRLIVGKMFSGVGVFTGCSIQFNGPYDFDGSPTDMDVSLRFMPSEFYDSETFTGLPSGGVLIPRSTPTGESEVTGGYPYALTFGETTTGMGVIIPPTGGTGEAPPPTVYPTMTNISQISEDRVTGPTKQTPTNAQVAIALGVSESEVHYDADKKTYTIGGTVMPDGTIVGGVEHTADWVQNAVLTSKVGTVD
jgi:hypothetical protein